MAQGASMSARAKFIEYAPKQLPCGACEWDEDFGAGVPLNELVAADGSVRQ